MSFVMALFVFFGTIGLILALFSAIVTSNAFEWPSVIMIYVILVPYLASKIYKVLLEYTDLDFLYVGHDISPEEKPEWKRIAVRMWLVLFGFAVLATAAAIGFMLTGGPTFQEFVLKQGRRVPVDRPLIDILISYSLYTGSLLCSAMVFGYFAVLMRGWYYSSHTSSRFFNTVEAVKNFLIRLLAKITGIEIRREE